MISLGIRRGAYSKNQQECKQYLDTKRLSSSYTGSRNRGTKGSALFFWCDVLQYRWARDTLKRGRYVVLLSNSSLNPGANGRNIVGCYMLRLSAHPVACCCVLLGVVAQSLKPVKLLATCKLACVPSVSNRVIARKLERAQKKKGGRGRGRGVIPLPSPPPPPPPSFLFLFSSQLSRGTREETLATQATCKRTQQLGAVGKECCVRLHGT